MNITQIQQRQLLCLSVALFFHSSYLVSADRYSLKNAPSAKNVAINQGTTTYDSHLSAVSLQDGTSWVTWCTYHNSQDKILLRKLSPDGERMQTFQVSEKGKIHGDPTVVVLNNNSLWVIWSSRQDTGWIIQARHLQNKNWEQVVNLSNLSHNAIHPTAAHIHQNQLVVAWSAYHQGKFSIRCRLLKGNVWLPTQIISQIGNSAFRPALTVTENQTVWAVWDQYVNKKYQVVGRQIFPDKSDIEQISPTEIDSLKPTILATSQGIFAAWLQKQDVLGGPGVVSQWHTLHVARRGATDWKIITDEEGNRVAAELTQGLMAKISPKPVPTGGYLGRRTTPMLLEDDNKIWLLWERKTDHRGSTAIPRGDLLGRPVQHNKLLQPLLLKQGLVEYHLGHTRRAINGQLNYFASQVFSQGTRIYYRKRLNLNEHSPYQQEHWQGWQPITLPVKKEQTQRRKIVAHNKKYKLYWADMHCHNNLSSDAEGEPDELNFYARDRAALDVVVFTNNDFYLVPLTQYEYELGNYFAHVFTKGNSFLSLPGYEWTSRIPGTKNAKLSDPGNWNHPYKNKSFPNHRSVIYPAKAGPVIRFFEVHNNIENLNRVVQAAGGITLTQHPAFQPSGHPVEIGMELTSGWGNYIRRVPKLFHGALNKGANLAFVACGDTHRRAPGLSGALTGIYAEELTIDAILKALKKRRCFATNGSRIFLDSRADGKLMGEYFEFNKKTLELSLHARGTRPILSAELIYNGKNIKHFRGNNSLEFKTTYRLEGLPPGRHWFYWRVTQLRDAPVLPGNLMVAHGHLAWSTPHYIHVATQ